MTAVKSRRVDTNLVFEWLKKRNIRRLTDLLKDAGYEHPGQFLEEFTGPRLDQIIRIRPRDGRKNLVSCFQMDRSRLNLLALNRRKLTAQEKTKQRRKQTGKNEAFPVMMGCCVHYTSRNTNVSLIE